MRYADGWAVDDQDRVVFENAPPNSYIQGIPTTKAGFTAGEQGGTVTNLTSKAGFDAEGKVVYIDLTTTPYKGGTYSSGGLTFTSAGAVLCQSGSPPARTSSAGVPLTQAGCLPIVAAATSGDYLVTDDGNQLICDNGDLIIT